MEMAVDCSTMECLQVLRRFCAIRGQPSLMMTDNGTQIVGAEKELRQMVSGLNQRQIQEFCAEKGIHWKFTTPPIKMAVQKRWLKHARTP